VTSFDDREQRAGSAAIGDGLDVLLRFGAAMIGAGNTAFRVREWMEALAAKMGLEALAVTLQLNAITASVRRAGETATLTREIAPPGVNSRRIGELEQLVETAAPGAAPGEIGARLAEIEGMPPEYPAPLIACAVGAACAGFGFLNNGGVVEIVAAGIGAGVGQYVRSLLARQRHNHFSTATLSAIAAAGTYCLVAALCARLGFMTIYYAAGFVSSILYLVPGFPLVGGLLDLMQYQTLIALARFAYAMMILLAAAFGLSIVIAVAGLDTSARTALELSEPLKQLFRALASFAGGCGFAMLFNSTRRAVLAVGLLALAANELRLLLHDGGMNLAPATFLATLAVGLVASLVRRRLKEPRIAITVPSIIIMVPGFYGFAAIVLFYQGRVLEALQAMAPFAFVTGAMAMGLAAARILTRR